MMDSDGGGEGGGVGTDGRGWGGTAGPLLSVCARCPCALVVHVCLLSMHACCLCALVVHACSLSVSGGHCWPCAHSLFVHGGSSLSMRPASSSMGGGLLFLWVLSAVGAGWSFCSWAAVIVCGCWALFVCTGSLSMCTGSLSVCAWMLFVGTELSLVGCGACLCEWGIHGCWFVVCGCSGDVLWAVWSLVSKSTLGKRGYLV